MQSKLEQGAARHTESSGRRRAFLDHMLVSEEARVLSEDEIREELKTLALGAADTTMWFMAAFLVSMGIEQRAQRKVHEVQSRKRKVPYTTSLIPSIRSRDRKWADQRACAALLCF